MNGKPKTKENKMGNKLLGELVREYKKKKDKKLLIQIFEKLQPTINKKANFICNELKKFNIEISDIKQELYIKIMEIIKNYNVEESFEKYFFASIWTWQPEIQIEDTINYESLSKSNEEGEPMEINIEDIRSEKPDANLAIEDILSECKTENERRICQLYLENPDISQEEIGKKLEITHQAISKILLEFRKRLVKRGLK